MLIGRSHKMDWKIWSVFIGGGLGSLLRFYIGLRLNPSNGFPYGTLAANIAASFLLGLLLAHYLSNPDWKSNYRLLLMTGFCGGFSTFSTFSSEVFLLLKNQQLSMAFGYLFVSILLGLLAVFVGMKIYSLT